MSGPSKRVDPWRLPTFLLWASFFLVGLLPDSIYSGLREMGAVAPQRALVNSPFLLTLALAGYVALFSFHRCRDVGLSIFQAQDRALQLGILALIAFLPVDPVAVYTAYANPMIANPYQVYVAAALKVVAWLCLLSMFVRYYVSAGDRVFADLPSVFPSARRAPQAAPGERPQNPVPAEQVTPPCTALEKDPEGPAPD